MLVYVGFFILMATLIFHGYMQLTKINSALFIHKTALLHQLFTNGAGYREVVFPAGYIYLMIRFLLTVPASLFRLRMYTPPARPERSICSR